MIESSYTYLASIALLALILGGMEKFSHHKLFTYLPAVVLIYAFAMLLAQLGLWEKTEQIAAAYGTVKRYLLPAMLFLMLMRVDLKHFASLGKKLLIAYFSAVLSIALAFIFVFWLLGFGSNAAGVFGALAGSWTGGTANMLAVASALNVDEGLMGYALVVDSVDYTLWVMFLLAIVGAAPLFNRWAEAESSTASVPRSGTAFKEQNIPLLLLLAFTASAISVSLSSKLGGLSSTTWAVLISTLMGLLASRTKLYNLTGSTALSSAMLYLLVALIGSRASFGGFDAIPIYLLAGVLILLLHAAAMISVAKIFKLDLFSIGVASLANIGGVASAPILAAAYNRSLVGIAVLMAVMGYLIGTVAGLAIAGVLKWMA
jgi:uncharacterized membrane protein